MYKYLISSRANITTILLTICFLTRHLLLIFFLHIGNCSHYFLRPDFRFLLPPVSYSFLYILLFIFIFPYLSSLQLQTISCYVIAVLFLHIYPYFSVYSFLSYLLCFPKSFFISNKYLTVLISTYLF